MREKKERKKKTMSEKLSSGRKGETGRKQKRQNKSRNILKREEGENKKKGSKGHRSERPTCIFFTNKKKF